MLIPENKIKLYNCGVIFKKKVSKINLKYLMIQIYNIECLQIFLEA